MENLLNYLIKSDHVQEIVIGPDLSVLEDVDGTLRSKPNCNLVPATLLEDLRRLIFSTGQTIDHSSPFVEVTIENKIRITAVIPPISPRGICIQLRKMNEKYYNLDTLLQNHTIHKKDLIIIEKILQEQKNIVICGGTSTGKTTLLNALLHKIAAFLPEQRIVTIEETSEIHLNHPNWLNLVTRQFNTEQQPPITLETLLRTSLRLRPDRIIVGECRGKEVFPLLQVLNSGHSGSICTLHANASHLAIKKLALMTVIHNNQIDFKTALMWIYENIDFVFFCKRSKTGKRVLDQITPIESIKVT